MSLYREHCPPVPLAASVACVWTLSGEASEPSRILPDGCMDLLFDLTGSEAPSFRMLALLEGVGRGMAWAELAVSLGFSDQAHLTRDLRQLAGVTPTELARSLSAATAHVAPASHDSGSADAGARMSDLFKPLPGPLPILSP